eukprot:c53864_g1_i1 orf=3-197(-)
MNRPTNCEEISINFLPPSSHPPIHNAATVRSLSRILYKSSNSFTMFCVIQLEPYAIPHLVFMIVI